MQHNSTIHFDALLYNTIHYIAILFFDIMYGNVKYTTVCTKQLSMMENYTLPYKKYNILENIINTVE